MEKVIDLTKSAANFIIFLKRNLFSSIFLVLLGSLTSYYLFVSGQESKKAEVTVLSSKVPFQFIEYILKPVKTYVNNSDHEAVAKLLDIDLEVTQNVGSISIEKIEGLVDEDFKNGFTISLQGKSAVALETFGNQCVIYLNSNEFIKEWKKVYTENLYELEKTAAEQILRLDSVQKMIPVMLQKTSVDNKNDFANFDIGSVYEQMITIKDHREAIVREIKFNRDFKVISTTFYPVNRISKKIFLISLLLVNIFILLLFFYVSIFYTATMKHVKNA